MTGDEAAGADWFWAPMPLADVPAPDEPPPRRGRRFAPALVAFDLATGAQLWARQAGPVAWTETPGGLVAGADAVVAFGAEDGGTLFQAECADRCDLPVPGAQVAYLFERVDAQTLSLRAFSTKHGGGDLWSLGIPTGSASCWAALGHRGAHAWVDLACDGADTAQGGSWMLLVP
jgi:hypothetical protein